MLRVGLTGGIGSGKSTVAERLAGHGAVVIDADRIAREVVEPGTDGLRELVAEFGREVLAADGSLDRPALAARVFADAGARAALNGIVHPRIGTVTAERMAQAAPEAVIVHDVPLLVEGRLAAAYHLVLVVDAPIEERVRRLSARGLAEGDARARIAAQATDEQRRAVADVWLDNGGRPDELRPVLDALWADRLLPYERNLRERRAAERGGPALVDYDPAWPAQAERIMARVRAAAGDRAVDLRHVGSTSVPGLAAKNVLDVQLGVRSIDEADALADALAMAGFPRYPEPLADVPNPANPALAAAPKRVHVNADPGRAVNLHVRVAGSPAWRYTVLFRDFLRAEPAEVADYLATKRRAAADHADGSARNYAVAKEPWFADALLRAEDWATRSGWTPPAD